MIPCRSRTVGQKRTVLLHFFLPTWRTSRATLQTDIHWDPLPFQVLRHTLMFPVVINRYIGRPILSADICVFYVYRIGRLQKMNYPYHPSVIFPNIQISAQGNRYRPSAKTDEKKSVSPLKKQSIPSFQAKTSYLSVRLFRWLIRFFWGCTNGLQNMKIHGITSYRKTKRMCSPFKIPPTHKPQ